MDGGVSWAQLPMDAIKAGYDEITHIYFATMQAMPISRDGYFGPYVQLQLVRIYLLVGEPEQQEEESAARLDLKAAS
mgnify:CR=1 FL=1